MRVVRDFQTFVRLGAIRGDDGTLVILKCYSCL